MKISEVTKISRKYRFLDIETELIPSIFILEGYISNDILSECEWRRFQFLGSWCTKTDWWTKKSIRFWHRSDIMVLLSSEKESMLTFFELLLCFFVLASLFAASLHKSFYNDDSIFSQFVNHLIVTIRKWTCVNSYYGAYRVHDLIFLGNLCNCTPLFEVYTGCTNHYNMNECNDNSIDYYQAYINLPHVRKAIHVGNLPFHNGI